MNYWQIEGHEGNRQENVVLHGRVKLTKCDNSESNQTYNEKTGPMKQIGRVECRWNVFLYLHFIIIDWRFWISKEMISFFFTSPPPPLSLLLSLPSSSGDWLVMTIAGWPQGQTIQRDLDTETGHMTSGKKKWRNCCSRAGHSRERNRTK